MSGINSSTLLWYVSRATGVVALLLMTAVLLLGLLVSRRGKLPGLPGFAATGLHRNLSLIGVVFIALHVLTAVTDGYVDIPLSSALVPLTSPYERLWLALGAVSLDLCLAIVVTSLVRGRLGRKTWKAIHYLAYLCWPIAWLHSYGASSDLRHGWLFVLALADLLVVVAAVGWRVAVAYRDVPRAQRVGLLMSAVHQRGRSR